MEGLMTVAAAEVLGFKHTLYLLMKNIMSCCRGSDVDPPERAVGCKICSKINISIFLFFCLFSLQEQEGNMHFGGHYVCIWINGSLTVF